MKVFLQSIIAQILLNAYLYHRGKQAIPMEWRSFRQAFTTFFILEILVFFVGFLCHRQLPDTIYLFILKLCSAWYIALIYMSMSMLMVDMMRFVANRFRLLPSTTSRCYGRLKLMLLFAIPLVGVVSLAVGYNNATQPIAVHRTIPINKSNSRIDTLRIALATDLHIGEMTSKKRIRRLVDFINAQQADIILLGGDIMDYESRFAEMRQIEDELQMLKAPLGVYAVLGNHEYRANRHAKLRWMEKTGVTLLVDSVVGSENGFYLIGRDDAINKRRKSLRQLTLGLDKSKAIVVLDHQPRTVSETIMNEIDLALHGHTHNGQLWPYPLLMKFIYINPYGHSRWGSTHSVVSSGIGHAGPPFRIGTRSEIQLIDVVFR